MFSCSISAILDIRPSVASSLVGCQLMVFAPLVVYRLGTWGTLPMRYGIARIVAISEASSVSATTSNQ